MDRDADDAQYESSAAQLADGQTEAILAAARETREAALAAGNHEVAAQALEVINDLGATHERAEVAHQEHGDARQHLRDTEES